MPIAACLASALAAPQEEWPQSRFDSRRSGHAPGRRVESAPGLLAAIPFGEAVFTTPAVAGDRAYVVDGAGAATCVDTRTFEVRWRTETRGGKANCNSLSSPAIAGRYLHFGTAAGGYTVLDADRGTLVREIACGSPVRCSPVLAGGRVYFATVGAEVYALEPDGTVAWTWDFVKEVVKFPGDRWSGEEWSRRRQGRLGQDDRFLSTGDIAVAGKTIVLPAGNAERCRGPGGIELGDEGGQRATAMEVPDPVGGGLVVNWTEEDIRPRGAWRADRGFPPDPRRTSAPAGATGRRGPGPRGPGGRTSPARARGWQAPCRSLRPRTLGSAPRTTRAPIRPTPRSTGRPASRTPSGRPGRSRSG